MEISTNGISFDVAPRYAAGHQLLEHEAEALNTAVANMIRARISYEYRKAKEKNPQWTPSADDLLRWEKLAKSFVLEPQAPRPDTRLEREALSLARAAVRNRMKEAGQPTKDRQGEIEQLAAELAQKPAVIEAARRQMEARQQALAAVGE